MTNYLLISVKGKIDGPSLCKLLEPKVKDFSTTADELREALQCFDKTGTQVNSLIQLGLSIFGHSHILMPNPEI